MGIVKYSPLVLFFIVILFIVSTVSVQAQSPVPTATPVSVLIVSNLSNCRITILDYETTASVAQYASLTNVKTLTVVTKVYVDNVLAFDETNYINFNKLFTGAYNYSFAVPKHLDSDRISVINTFYIRNGGQSTYIKNCNWGAKF